MLVGGKSGVGCGPLRADLRGEATAVEDDLRHIGEHAACNEAEQITESVRCGRQIAAYSERGVKLRLGHADPRGSRRERPFGAAHIGSLAQGVGRDADSDLRRGGRDGSGDFERAGCFAGGLSRQHGDAIEAAAQIGFLLRDGGTGLCQLGAGLLLVQRGDETGLQAPPGNVEIILLNPFRFPRDPQLFLREPRLHIIGDQFGNDRQTDSGKVITGRGKLCPRRLRRTRKASKQVDLPTG